MPIKVFWQLARRIGLYNFFSAVVIVSYRHVWTCLDKSENIFRIVPNHIYRIWSHPKFYVVESDFCCFRRQKYLIIFVRNLVIPAIVKYTLDRLLALSYNCSCTVVSCSIIHDIIASDGRRNDDLLIFNA